MTNFWAYKLAFVQLLLTEASDISKKLDLPTPHPIRQDNAKSGLTDPEFGLIGSVRTTNFVFRFGTEDRLRSFALEPEDKLRDILQSQSLKFYNLVRHKNGSSYLASFELNKLVDKPSVIDPKGAYQLATNWLPALSINVAELESRYGKPKIYRQLLRFSGATNVALPKAARESYEGEAPLGEQVKGATENPVIAEMQKRYGVQPGGSNDWVRLPIFHLEWGKKESDPQHRKFGIPVEMIILGTTKELVELNIGTPEVVKKSLVLTNAAELLKISDPPNLKLQKPTAANSRSSALSTNVVPVQRPKN